MSNREVKEHIYNIPHPIDVNVSPEDILKGYTLEGKWDEVVTLYESDPKLSTIEINKSRGTALHVAVNDGNDKVVKKLVKSILRYNNVEALKCKNEKGDTPLHLAASRGFKDICECIIGKGEERKYLIEIENENGETPLFLAALSWQKLTFVYLLDLKPSRWGGGAADRNYPEDYFYSKDLFFEEAFSKDLIRSNGDSILHCAIQREFFDLALIIVRKYPDLKLIPNKQGFSPLKLLATRPSAFYSGCKMIWWKRILYHCIPVETLNVVEAIEYYRQKHESKPQKSCPKNYDTCYLFLHKCRDACRLIRFKKVMLENEPNPEEEKEHEESIDLNVCPSNEEEEKEHEEICQDEFQDSFPSNDEINNDLILDEILAAMEEGSNIMGEARNMGEVRIDHHRPNISMTSGHLPENYTTCLWFLNLAYYYILVLSGVGVEEIKKMKQRHRWSGQLLNIFMMNPYESYLGIRAKPIQDASETDFVFAYNPNQAQGDDTNISETKEIAKMKLAGDDTNISETKENETTILTAARNGIVEIVEKLITKVPSSIYDVNIENKNVLHVAVENKRTNVVEALRKLFEKYDKKATFDTLIQGVDKEENTVLHLAATRSDRDLNIPGAALQMMWNSKCFQYTEGLVPEYFKIRTNLKGETAEELFKNSHAKLANDGSTWLKETSESCSVVAALLAGVSFAASSTVPGGNRSETGEPTLEGKPAFDAFALSSLIGLCFSLTALIMFLSILTSRKEARDFRNDLPRKLLVGLSSLFLSIIAMFTAFCSGNFFLIEHRYKHMVFLIYATTSFPVTLYAMAQLPLYIDLLEVL